MAGVARGSAINLVGSACTAVATFLLTVLMTRLLPTDAVGAFFSITSLFLLLTTLGQLGTSSGIVYFLARQPPDRRLATGLAYLRTAAIPVFTVAVVMGGLMIAFADPLSDLLGVDSEPSSVTSLWVLGLGIPLAAALNLYTSATRGLGSMRATAVLDQIVRPTLQLVLVGAAALAGKVLLVVVAWTLPYLPTAIASDAGGIETSRHDGKPGHERVSAMNVDFWRFTAPRALAGVAQVAMQRLDIVLVGALAGLAEAAIYTAATRFLVVGQLAGTAHLAGHPAATGSGDRVPATRR